MTLIPLNDSFPERPNARVDLEELIYHQSAFTKEDQRIEIDGIWYKIYTDKMKLYGFILIDNENNQYSVDNDE